MASKTKGRVNIPRNPGELLDLAESIYSKHTADGATSPLNSLADNDWSVTGPKVATALTLHDQAEMYKGLMEKSYAERDIYMLEIDSIVRNSATLLKAINSKNPKRLSDWGFSVDDTPPGVKSQNGTQE